MFHRTAFVRITLATSLFAALAAGGCLAHGAAVEPFGPRTGDATGDGVVNAFDALHVLFYGAGLSSEQSDRWHAAVDANADSMANAIDAALILQDAAGLIHLPL
jgi:hypothetical protein